MRLVLVRPDGVAETIMIDVEQYNWNKRLPQEILLKNLQEAIRKAKREQNKDENGLRTAT